MTNMRLAGIKVEPISGGNPQLFGMVQSQDFDPGSVIPGTFIAEIFDEEGTDLIVKDVQNGLPPVGKGGGMQMVASIIPNTSIRVLSFYQEDGNAAPIDKQQTVVPYPEGGWGGKQIELIYVLA